MEKNMRRMELDAGIKNIMVIVPHEDDEILLAAGIMEKALAQAKDGRLHILGIMNQTIEKPKENNR